MTVVVSSICFALALIASVTCVAWSFANCNCFEARFAACCVLSFSSVAWFAIDCAWRSCVTAYSSRLLEPVDHPREVGGVVLELAGDRAHRHRAIGREQQQHLGLDGGQLVLSGEVGEVRLQARLHLEPEPDDLTFESQVL